MRVICCYRNDNVFCLGWITLTCIMLTGTVSHISISGQIIPFNLYLAVSASVAQEVITHTRTHTHRAQRPFPECSEAGHWSWSGPHGHPSVLPLHFPFISGVKSLPVRRWPAALRGRLLKSDVCLLAEKQGKAETTRDWILTGIFVYTWRVVSVLWDIYSTYSLGAERELL